MSEKILTVIVPVYNKEKLIRKCLDSFASDSFNETLEVIVVDDGSVDSSYDIAVKYAKMFPAIFCPVRKENGGVGSVINIGLKMAHGKYVKEVDADDWVDTNALKRLISCLEQSDADIVLNPFCEVGAQGNRLKENYFKGIYFHKIYPVEDVVNRVLFCIQSITVRKKLLDDRQFTCKEDKYYIDMQFVDTCILFASTCMMLSDSLYRYRKEQEGQSVSLSSYIKNYKSFYSQVMLSFDRLHYIQANPQFKNKNMYFRNTSEGYSLYMYAIFLISSCCLEEWKQFDDFLCRDYKEIYTALERYRCVRYMHNWKCIPFKVKQLVFLRLWNGFIKREQKVMELRDVRKI